MENTELKNETAETAEEINNTTEVTTKIIEEVKESIEEVVPVTEEIEAFINDLKKEEIPSLETLMEVTEEIKEEVEVTDDEVTETLVMITDEIEEEVKKEETEETIEEVKEEAVEETAEVSEEIREEIPTEEIVETVEEERNDDTASQLEEMFEDDMDEVKEESVKEVTEAPVEKIEEVKEEVLSEPVEEVKEESDQDEKIIDLEPQEEVTEDTASNTLSMEKLTDVGMEDEKPVKKSMVIMKEIFEFFRDLILCFIVVVLVTTYVAKPVRVKGSSMYPTLEDGALAFSNVYACNKEHINRFDVAIVYIPEKSEYLVKRVIGLPGETLRYEDGVLYINDEVVEEDFLDAEYRASFGNRFMDDVQSITLDEDEYYCLGDNRPNSMDSRYYGPFNISQITAKGIAVFWPFENAGIKTW